MRVIPLLLLAPLFQEEASLPSPWQGFKAGSWILTEQSRVRTGEGDENLSPVLAQRQSVETVGADGIPTLKRWIKSSTDPDFRDDGSAPAHVKLIALTAGMKEKARRREKWAIGNRTVDGTVVECSGEALLPGHERTMAIWTADGIVLPPRETGLRAGRVGLSPDVARIVAEDRRGGIVQKWTLSVVDLSAPRTVGGEKLDCSIEEIRFTTEHPNRPTLVRSSKRWICDAVPGRVVRREEDCRAGESGGCYTVQVAAFKAVR